MSVPEVEKLIGEQMLCRIAFQNENAPYIAPFQYTLLNGQLYFHFTDYGKKMGLLQEGNSVCVEIERYNQDFSEYEFVVLTGNLRITTEPQERRKAIDQMINTAKTKCLSENFLVAHGVPKEASWESLASDDSIIIVKLENLTERIGLKSP